MTRQKTQSPGCNPPVLNNRLFKEGTNLFMIQPRLRTATAVDLSMQPINRSTHSDEIQYRRVLHEVTQHLPFSTILVHEIKPSLNKPQRTD
jgi:hypothetical protein